MPVVVRVPVVANLGLVPMVVAPYCVVLNATAVPAVAVRGVSVASARLASFEGAPGRPVADHGVLRPVASVAWLGLALHGGLGEVQAVRGALVLAQGSAS